MLSYLVRRVLLFVPTILGATFIVFMLMALSPISIIDVLLPPTGDMLPGQREEREAYLNERYGLKSPAPVQFFRWANNVSPVGLPTWRYNDPEVLETREVRRIWRAEATARVASENPELDPQAVIERVDELEAEQDLGERARQAWRKQTLDAVLAEDPSLSPEQAQARVDELEDERGAFGPLPGDIKWSALPMGMFKAPDLGDSFTRGRPVESIIAERLPITLLLNILSLPLSLAIALLAGIWSAKHRGGWQDWSAGGLMLALYSVPVIWVGVMFIGFLANDQYLRLFPAAGIGDITADQMAFFPSWDEGGFERGWLLDRLWHLALPVVCLSYVQFAYLTKLTRTSLLETLNADYVRTARAKGLSPNAVLYRHAFRNSLIPLITFLAALLPAMITGSIVVETIFTIDGMGRLTFEALTQNDRELFLSVAVIILLLKLLAYLLADIAYVVADPRVSYS